MRERVVVLPCRHRRPWPAIAACAFVGALAAYAVHVECDAARVRDESRLLHGGIARIPVHPASEADLLATRIQTQLGILKALGPTRDVERLVAEWIALRELIVRAGGLPELRRHLPMWNLLVQEISGERRSSLWLQTYLANGNQGLRQLADAVQRRDLASAEAAHAWIEATVEEMRREEREVFHRTADALEQRGQKLFDEAHRLCVEGSSLLRLEAEVRRLETELAKARAVATIERGFELADRWKELGHSERVQQELERVSALVQAGHDWDSLSVERIRWIRRLDALDAWPRGVSSITFPLRVAEGNCVLRALERAVEARDSAAANDALGQAELVAAELRSGEREVHHRNAEALMARAEALRASLRTPGDR